MTRNKWYWLWYGGSSYSLARYEDLEEFDSLAAMREEFDGRYNWPHMTREGMATPCVDETASAWMFYGRPKDDGDLYPDRIMSIGPRGGIRIERA